MINNLDHLAPFISDNKFLNNIINMSVNGGELFLFKPLHVQAILTLLFLGYTCCKVHSTVDSLFVINRKMTPNFNSTKELFKNYCIYTVQLYIFICFLRFGLILLNHWSLTKR